MKQNGRSAKIYIFSCHLLIEDENRGKSLRKRARSVTVSGMMSDER